MFPTRRFRLGGQVQYIEIGSARLTTPSFLFGPQAGAGGERGAADSEAVDGDVHGAAGPAPDLPGAARGVTVAAAPALGPLRHRQLRKYVSVSS